MKHAFKSLVGAAVVVSIVVAAGTASADDESKCHQTIGKNIAKYQAGLAKAVIGCHKANSGGKAILGTARCNVTNVAGQGADQKSKRAANRQKVIDGIAKSCTNALAPNTLAMYTACPSPNAGTIANFADVANCLMNLSESYISDIGEQLLGDTAVGASVSDAAADCQGAIGKAFSKFVKTVGGSRTKCNAALEKIALTSVNYDTCADGDPDGKIGPALSALNTAIATSCAAATGDFDTLNNCAGDLASPTTTALAACGVTKVANPVANGLAAAALELPGTCAPIATVTINAANGIKATATRLDSGWKGTAHEVDIVDQSVGAVTLSNCDANCKNCEVTHNPQEGNCRCESDPTRRCDVIEGNDNDVAPNGCAGLASQACHCMFGPPLAISASATPVCVVNRFAEEFDGLTGEVGEYTVGTRTRALVHTGISQVKPCPTCVGDANPNSGNSAGGTCSGGPRNGLACDENAEHPDFGPTSFDCPPSTGANISGSGLNLALSFTSGASSVNAAIPAAGAFCDGAADCHCSVCTGDAKVGCTTNAQCAAVGAGTCGVALANNPKQNNCDTSCTNDGNGNGECDGPVISYCDGFDNGFGNPIITCSVDGDCDANDCNGDTMLTPGECGTCTAAEFPKCFLPSVTATGTPGIFESNGVSVFCSGQTGNSGVDNAGGLPGPGRVKLNFDFDLFCSDGTTQYQLPSGSNCP